MANDGWVNVGQPASDGWISTESSSAKQPESGLAEGWKNVKDAAATGWKAVKALPYTSAQAGLGILEVFLRQGEDPREVQEQIAAQKAINPQFDPGKPLFNEQIQAVQKARKETIPQTIKEKGLAYDPAKDNKWVYAIGAGAPSLAASVGLTLAFRNPMPATILFGAQSFGQTAGEALDAGKTPDQALALGTAAGVAEGYLEKVGLDFMMDPKVRSTALKAIVRSSSEAIQEMSQTFKDNVISKMGYKDTRAWTQGLLESGVAGFVLGGTAHFALSPFEIKAMKDAGATDDDIQAFNTIIDMRARKEAQNIIDQAKPAEVNYAGMPNRLAKSLGTQIDWLSVTNAEDIYNQLTRVNQTKTFTEPAKKANQAFPESAVKNKVYHGTSHGNFTQFDPYGSNTGLYGPGSYFTEDVSVATKYRKKGEHVRLFPGGPLLKNTLRGEINKQLFEADLDIKNPIDMDAPKQDFWEKIFPEYQSKTAKTNGEAYRQIIKQIADQDDLAGGDSIGIEAAGELFMDRMLSKTNFDGVTHIGGNYIGDGKKLHRVWVAWKPEQIKASKIPFGTVQKEGRYSPALLSKIAEELWTNDPRGDVRRLKNQFAVNKLAPLIKTKTGTNEQMGFGDEVKAKLVKGIELQNTPRTVAAILDGSESGEFTQKYREIRKLKNTENQIYDTLMHGRVKNTVDMFPGVYQKVADESYVAENGGKLGPKKLTTDQRIDIEFMKHNAADAQVLRETGYGWYVDNDFSTPQEKRAAIVTNQLSRELTPERVALLQQNTGKVIQIEDWYLPRSYLRYSGVPNTQEDQLFEGTADIWSGKNKEGKVLVDNHSAHKRTNKDKGEFKLGILSKVEHMVKNYAQLKVWSDQLGPLTKHIKNSEMAIKQSFGEELAGDYKNNVVQMVMGTKPDADNVLAIMTWLADRGYTIALSRNPVKMGVVQLGSLINTDSEIGLKWTMDGLKTSMTQEFQDDVAKYPELRNRMAEVYLQDMMDQLKASGRDSDVQKGLDWVKQNGWFGLMVQMDKYTAGAAFEGAKHKFIAENPGATEIQAVEYALDILEDTQSMTQDMFRAKIHQKKIGRMFTSFLTQPLAWSNSTIRKGITAYNTGDPRAKKAFIASIAGGIAAGMYQGFMDYLFTKGLSGVAKQMRDLEKKKNRTALIGKIGRSMIGMTTIYGQFISSLLESRGNPTYIFEQMGKYIYQSNSGIGSRKAKMIDKLYGLLKTYLITVHRFPLPNGTPTEWKKTMRKALPGLIAGHVDFPDQLGMA